MKTIPLIHGKVAIVDDEDYDRVSKIKWTLRRAKYGGLYAVAANRDSSGKRPYLHRFILNAPDEIMVDHKDGNGLDCRRNNLRHATPQQNSMNVKKRIDNKSGHSGVFWDKKKEKWRVSIAFKRKRIHLGMFEKLRTAISVRKEAEKTYFGEYARSP